MMVSGKIDGASVCDLEFCVKGNMDFIATGYGRIFSCILLGVV